MQLEISLGLIIVAMLLIFIRAMWRVYFPEDDGMYCQDIMKTIFFLLAMICATLVQAQGSGTYSVGLPSVGIEWGVLEVMDNPSGAPSSWSYLSNDGATYTYGTCYWNSVTDTWVFYDETLNEEFTYGDIYLSGVWTRMTGFPLWSGTSSITRLL